MRHPYFDALDWPGSRADAQEFEKALLSGFSNAKEIKNIYRKVADDLVPLTDNQAPPLIWAEALHNIVASGKLEAFCQLLRAQGPKNAAFQQRLDAVFNATSAIERRLLLSGVPVVDRDPLRAQIALLLAKDSPVGVLLSRGNPKSGKTWGRWLFQDAAEEAGATPIYVGKDLVFTLDDVINELFSTIGGVPSQLRASKATTPNAWYLLICQQLLKVANTKRARLWIAADDLGLIDVEILEFFNQFALMLQAPQYRERFRLMLIHYPEGTPTRWPAVIWRADTAVADDIKEDQIIDFLRGWSEERGKVIVEEQLKSLSNQLITQLDAPLPPAPAGAPEPPEVPRLQRLFDLATAMTQQLEQA